MVGEFEVYSHVRKSEFRTVNWGRADGKNLLLEGEDSLGFNTYYGHRNSDEHAYLIQAGVDFISNCTMSGGHQMDLRSECDWSDPYVVRGGTMRVVQRAMIDRQRPNVPGIHFYDEPGLTWEGNPASPHAIPAQLKSYESAFGQPPISYRDVDPKKPEDVARWNQWARWKLGFMDAAWKDSQFGVSRVRPDFLSLTQSQYGFTAFTDGYYFNVVRSLPITSGHGGYHDYGPGFFNPSYFLEMARARDRWKPNWYLPCWYGNTTSDQFRLEQYLSFSTNIQGMISPPDMEPATNATGRQGIVETNRLFQKLGPVFNALPVEQGPVALLFSLSQMIHSQTSDMNMNYAAGIPHGANMPLAYLAGKLIQQQFMPIVEEDVLDGTLERSTSRDPAHVAGLSRSACYLGPEAFCRRRRAGAADQRSQRGDPGSGQVAGGSPDARARSDRQTAQGARNTTSWDPTPPPANLSPGPCHWPKPSRAELDKVGIRPIFECDLPTVIATRQQAGDIEYLFAVNATYDDATEDKNAVKAATATISLADDGRPIYDAVRGGAVSEFKSQRGKLAGAVSFRARPDARLCPHRAADRQSARRHSARGA